MRQQLWEPGTFVDFDNNLNAAVRKLREALADSATEPRFVETLPRRGYRFLAPVTVSLLTERRDAVPFGLAGGAPGAAGRNEVVRNDGRAEVVPGRATLHLAAGDELSIATPGGGGYGPAPVTTDENLR